MVVEAQLEAPVRGDLAQLVQAVAQELPLGVVHHMLVAAGEHGYVHLALDGVALLADVDAVGAHGSQEVQVGDEVLLLLLKGAGQEEGGVPAAGDAHAAQVQGLLQLGRILGILVADLAAGEARQRHLADGLLEGVLRAQLRHIVVAPADGCDAQEYVVGIKHWNFPLVKPQNFSSGPVRAGPHVLYTSLHSVFVHRNTESNHTPLCVLSYKLSFLGRKINFFSRASAIFSILAKRPHSFS